MIKNYYKGIAAIFVSALCFSTIGTIGVLLFNGGANPITILIGRFFIATLMLFLTILIFNRKLFYIAKKDIKMFLLAGIILFAHLLSFWYGFNLIKSVAIQYSLFFTYPIWTAIISTIFLRKKINKIIPIAIAIGSFGILLVLGIIPNGFTSVSIAGILFGILTAFLWALYYFACDFLRQKYNAFTIIFYNFLMTFVLTLFIQPIPFTLSQITSNVLIYLVAIAFIATYMSYLFLQFALKINGPILSSIHNMILPALGIFVAFLILHQTVNIFQILGTGLIISNIYLLNKKNV